MKRLHGFTVIELLVIITVIAVLAAITTIGFSQYQATTRDSQRQAKATVISEALEKYYEEHGEYPSCPAITDTPSTVTGTGGALERVDPIALVAPLADDGIQNSIECADLTMADDDYFAYVGDGSGTCQTGDSCLEYTLKYKDEQSGQIISIESRHQTDIVTSGGNTINSTSVNSSRIDVSWTAISNASSYVLQRATNSGFSTGVVNTTISGTSTSVTSLASGTRYWFRVQGVSSSGNTAWSSSTNAYTYPGIPGSVSATTASTTQIDITWSAVTGATSYRVQRSTTSNFAGGTTGSVSGVTGTSHSQTGLQPGTQYWFRVYATNSAGEGGASSIDNAITSLSAPTGLATTNTANSVNVSWSAVTNATAYDVEYSTSASFSPLAGSFNNQTATSRNITGLSPGVTYYVRVFAENSLTRSSSASTSATTTPPAPVCGATTGSSNRQIVPDWDAASGATSYTVQYGPNNYNTEITGITGTFTTINNLNNGTTYTSRVRANAGSASSAWTNCPNRTTGVDGPTSVTWSGRGEAVRCYGCVAWMPGQDPGYGSTWWTVGMYISGTCQPGATVVTRLYSYYAYSNGSSANNASLMDWTWGAQDRYMVSGSDSWYGWFQGWVACQVGSTRAGDTYLGNAGPY